MARQGSASHARERRSRVAYCVYTMGRCVSPPPFALVHFPVWEARQHRATAAGLFPVRLL